MDNIQKKIDKWLEKNEVKDMSEFFEWLQGTEYPGSEVEDNGISGQGNRRWYTLKYKKEAADFYI